MKQLLTVWGATTTIATLLIAVAPARAAPPARVAPGTTVVDATGAVVGYLLEEAIVNAPTIEREITSGVWVAMPGFLAQKLNPSPLTTFYQSSDCTGTAYADASGLPVVAEAVPDAAKPNTIDVSYPAPPYGFVTIGSILQGVPTPTCSAFGLPVYVGKLATVPFSVTFPLSVQ